jgi:hypothetical protein
VACASENPALAPVDTPEAADDASTGTGTGTAGGSSPDPSSGEGTTPSLADEGPAVERRAGVVAEARRCEAHRPRRLVLAIEGRVKVHRGPRGARAVRDHQLGERLHLFGREHVALADVPRHVGPARVDVVGERRGRDARGRLADQRVEARPALGPQRGVALHNDLDALASADHVHGTADVHPPRDAGTSAALPELPPPPPPRPPASDADRLPLANRVRFTYALGGTTGARTARVPVEGCGGKTVTLVLAISEVGDTIYDSAVAIDRIAFE